MSTILTKQQIFEMVAHHKVSPQEAFKHLKSFQKDIRPIPGKGKEPGPGLEPARENISSRGINETWVKEKIQKELLEIAAHMLMVNESDLEIDRDIQEYGFDSITLTNFIERVNEKFHLDIMPTVFFELDPPTLRTLAHHLYREHSPGFLQYYRDRLKKNNESKAGKARAKKEPTDQQPPAEGESIQREEQVVERGKPGAQGVNREPIAIIGMSGVMPQSEDMETFREHLEAGDDLITEVPPDRWDWKALSGTMPNARWGGFMKEVDKFDAEFFGISPREARLMDPQQRIFLEILWKTIEDAGYRPSDLSGTKTGIFVGTSSADYQEVLLASSIPRDTHAATGSSHSMLPNRVSYILNLHGPSEPIDTACSSSLAAVHRGVEAINSGSCQMAIVGGINVIVTPSGFIALNAGGVLACDGRCKTFDRDADGFVRSEGGGAVFLKPLGKAETDGDHIYAVIRGTAVNHGGRAHSLTAPNANAQAALLVEAYENARIDPSTVSYIETHGTGTNLGDPVEINGLKKAFAELYKRKGISLPKKPFCGLGSVKTNIGHLEAAAGIAGLIKVLLAMKYKKIPANIHFKNLNPYLQLEGTPFYVVTETIPWHHFLDEENQPIPRRAGVSSFGFGGSNAHVVLEERQVQEKQTTEHINQDRAKPYLFVFSAKNEPRLNAYIKKMIHFLEKIFPSADASLIDRKSTKHIREELLNTASRILNVNKNDIHPDEVLEDWGFDQVTLSILADQLEEKYHRGINLETLLQYPSIHALALYISGEKPTPPDSREVLPTEVSLADMAYTLQVGREPMEERLAIVASTTAQLWEKLNQYYHSNKGSINIPGVYQGNSNNSKQEIQPTEIKTIVENEDLEKIARLFIAGIDFDWQSIYPVNKPGRISLPTYPFARTRHWIEDPGEPRENHQLKQKESAMNHQNMNLKRSKIQLVMKNRQKQENPAETDTQIIPQNRKIVLKKDSNFPVTSIPLSPQPLQPSRHVKQEAKAAVGLSPGETRGALVPRIKEILAQVLFMDMGKIDENKAFMELGLDSILAVEFTKRLQEVIQVEIKATKLYDYSTVDKLADYLATLTPVVSSAPPPSIITAGHDAGTATGPGIVPLPDRVTYSPVTGLENLPGPGIIKKGDAGNEAGDSRQNALLLSRVKEILARVLFMDPVKLDENKPFMELGLDSILAVEFTKKINEAFQVDVKATKLYDYSTVKALVSYLHSLDVTGNKDITMPAEDSPVPSMLQSTPAITSVLPILSEPAKSPPPPAASTLSSHREFMDIAIIGISGRFPGANNITQYWENLANGVDSVTEVPKDRWDTAQYFDPHPNIPNKTYCKWGGFLTDIDKFDPLFFNISPAEAESLDPQQRLFLEEAWKALEDAGYSAESLDKKKCGVYAGIMSDGEYPSYSMFNVRSILASRISYFLNLKGPALSLDTACSSALVAMHLACQSLIDDETDMMLAGGVTLYLTEIPFIRMSRMGGILSPEGKCKTFDNSADGFVPAEGVGVVVLKLLERAIADGDHIYGVIKGSAMNHDGRTNGITAPSGESQRDLELEVYKNFGINPVTISYVEAHGTGTKLGDPIEIDALCEAFRQYTDKRQFCPIGSVKTNIGHTSAAAGAASVIKVILSMKYQKIPPSLHFHHQNEHINFKNSTFYVNTGLSKWQRPANCPRRAAVSAFGFSGTNVHMVIEEPPEPVQTPVKSSTPFSFIPISARSEEVLKNRCRDIARCLQAEENQLRLRDIAYTLGAGRSHFAYRSALIVHDIPELEAALKMISEGGTPGHYYTNKVNKTTLNMETQAAAIKEKGKCLTNELQPVNIPLMSDNEYKNRLLALADLYVKGYDPDWRILYQGLNYQRVSLPTYPFARDRYWVSAPDYTHSTEMHLTPPPAQTLNETCITEQIQKDLIQFLQKILKVKEKDIDIDLEMFQYGFDSILFLDYMKQINSTYGIEFAVESFFDLGNPTIRSLSETLYTRYKERFMAYFRESMEKLPIKIPPFPQTREPVQVQDRLNLPVHEPHEPVAIIGMSGIMPRCDDPETFWKNLEAGKSLITGIPRQQEESETTSAGSEEGDGKPGGFLNAVDQFDADFFGISLQEAGIMDPRHRILLETAWKAIEDAGYKPSGLSGTKTGVFVGISCPAQEQRKRINTVSKIEHREQTFWGNNATSMAANGISYLFNLRGPSEVIDTGWSGSLAAVHRAVEAIHSGLCRMAIAGGVNIILNTSRPQDTSHHEKQEIPGEGAGIILLKPFSQAAASGDHIYALIKGTSENHGGCSGFSIPPDAAVLMELFIDAYERNHIDPGTITYYETNGIPTEPGPTNSTEIYALKTAFAQLYKRKGKELPKESYCGIGSLRPNIGHLQSASGIAGLIKVLLSMQHKKMPVTLCPGQSDSQAQLKETPFYMVTETRTWECRQGEDNRLLPRQAGISSFAPGGTNVHVVVEECSTKPSLPGPGEPRSGDTPQLILLSARNQKCLNSYAGKLKDFLEKTGINPSRAAAPDKSAAHKGNLRQKIEDDILQISNQTLKINPQGYEPASIHDFVTQINSKFNLEINEEVFNRQPSPGAFIRYLGKNYKAHFIRHYTRNRETHESNYNLPDIAYTLQMGRYEMDERLALVVSNIEELKEKLKAYCQGKTKIENLYTGNAHKTGSQLLPLMEGEEKEEFIKQIIKNRKFTKLAYCWVLGVEIDWDLLYPAHRPKRISLPTYPFERKKHPIVVCHQRTYKNKKNTHIQFNKKITKREETK